MGEVIHAGDPIIRNQNVTPKIEGALNKLSATLTIDDLKKLNKKVEVDKADPEAGDTKYPQQKGLTE